MIAVVVFQNDDEIQKIADAVGYYPTIFIDKNSELPKHYTYVPMLYKEAIAYGKYYKKAIVAGD